MKRRQFLRGGAAAALIPSARSRAAEDESPFSFLVVADTHYHGDLENPTRLDPRSRDITGRLMTTLNELPGRAIPDSLGGGTVRAPAFVIHGGDLIESGDKAGNPKYRQLMPTEWAAYEEDFGLDGTGTQLRYPVYEVHGNHDSPQSEGLVIDGIAKRNRHRKNLVGISGNGLFCSWNHGGLHFVTGGITVARDEVPAARQRRYAPRDSLRFVADDLAKNAPSGRPAILIQHVDIARYSRFPADAEKMPDFEWNPDDVHDFHDAITNYNVLADFHGHTHGTSVTRWNGSEIGPDLADGIRVFNVDNAGHFSGGVQGFFYVEASPTGLVVRELQSKDGWQTSQWTKRWNEPII